MSTDRITAIKAKATRLGLFLKRHQYPEIPRSNLLHAAAFMEGYEDWHVLLAEVKSQAGVPRSEGPRPAELRTLETALSELTLNQVIDRVLSIQSGCPYIDVKEDDGSGAACFISNLLIEGSGRYRNAYVIDTYSKFKKTCEYLGGDSRSFLLRKKKFQFSLFAPSEDRSTGSIPEMVSFIGKLCGIPRFTSEESKALKSALRKASSPLSRRPELREILETLRTEYAKPAARVIHSMNEWAGASRSRYAPFFEGQTHLAPQEGRIIRYDVPDMDSVPQDWLDLAWDGIVNELTHVISEQGPGKHLPDLLIMDGVGLYEASTSGVHKTLEELLTLCSRNGVKVLVTNDVSERPYRVLDIDDEFLDCALTFHHQNRFIEGMRSVPGKKNSFLLMTKDGHAAKCGVEPSPLNFAINTTAPRDREMIEKMRESSGSYAEAIKSFAALFPRGVR